MLTPYIKTRLKAIKEAGEIALIALGKECVVSLSGFEEDADRINDLDAAFQAITAVLYTEKSAVSALLKDREKGAET